MPLLPDWEMVRLVVTIFSIALVSVIPPSRIMLPHAGRNLKPSTAESHQPKKDVVIKHYGSCLSNIFGYNIFGYMFILL